MESHLPGTAPDFLKSHEIVRAGAGAGKTYALTHKVMDLADESLRSQGRFPRMIVTTFTRKATQELRERLMLLALEERPHLVDFVNSRGHLVVSTIHGIMDMYLKRYGANICVDPSYRVVGAPEAAKLARQTLRQVLFADGQPSDLLEAFPFNSLVGLVRRVDAIVAENPDARPFGPEDFAEIFRRRSAAAVAMFKEIAARIREETTKENWHEMADAFDQLAGCLTRDWAGSGRETFVSVREKMPIAKRSSKGAQPVDEATMQLAKEARALAGEFCEALFDPAAWSLFGAQYEIINDVARRFSEKFRAAKIEQGLLEISDLELLAMKCLRAHPETGNAFSEEWDFWLVDEYQDTSPFQVDLIRRLAGSRPSFIVGDPQQSIYLFRGARSEVFGTRENQILEAGGTRRLLSVNRRSRPEVLLFLNDFFTRLHPPFQPMEPFIKDGQPVDASVVVATVFIGDLPDVEPGEKADDDGGAGPEPGATEPAASRENEGVESAKNAAEYRAVIRHVQKLLAEGANPEDICVLARTYRVLADVAVWLDRYRLPAQLHAASGFFDRREIRDALAFLKFLVNPHDGENTVELLRSPWFRVPDRAIVQLARKRPQTVSLWDRLIDERSMSDELRSVARLQEYLQLAESAGLSEAFLQGLIAVGAVDLAHTHDVSGRRESNLWKLVSRLQQEECRPGFNPLAFISRSRADLMLEEGNTEGDAVAAVEPNRINLMTVHKSKGLEFKHVILPRMEQRPQLTNSETFTYDERVGRWALRVPFGEDQTPTQSLPEADWLESFKTAELEEHARVLYVALTRASESVFLSWTRPIQRNSWAESVPLDLAQGLHRETSYSYVVETEDREPSANAKTVAKSGMKVRTPWSASAGQSDPVGAKKPMSVTEYLDKKPGVSFKIESNAEIARLLKLASRGTAVHRLMELLKYRSRIGVEKLVRKWFPGQEDRVLEAVNFVRETTEPAILEIIENGEVEKGFAFTEGAILIEGQIDLWGRTNDGRAWIIDYKTGSPELREKAFDQMALYSLALRRSDLLKPNEPLWLAAVYPFSREIFVESAPTPDQVRHRLKLRDFH